jgi:hypothetical protein
VNSPHRVYLRASYNYCLNSINHVLMVLWTLSIVRRVKYLKLKSLLPFQSPDDESSASFRNVMIFLIFNILLFGGWIKSIKTSTHNIIQHRQNLLEFSINRFVSIAKSLFPATQELILNVRCTQLVR